MAFALTRTRPHFIVCSYQSEFLSIINPEASFVDDPGADSLDLMELIMVFEEKFGQEIPDEAAKKIQTVKDAID